MEAIEDAEGGSVCEAVVQKMEQMGTGTAERLSLRNRLEENMAAEQSNGERDEKSLA